VSAIVDELAKMAAAYRQLGHTTSVYSIVLDHGSEYEAAPLPAGIARGVPKQCFQNAIDIADDDELVYAEGYMLRPGVPFLIHHAWCVTPAGDVVDPTIEDPETCAYYGIDFQLDWIISLGRTGLALERFAARLMEEGRL
jgi:hypothetical protein